MHADCAQQIARPWQQVTHLKGDPSALSTSSTASTVASGGPCRTVAPARPAQPPGCAGAPSAAAAGGQLLLVGVPAPPSLLRLLLSPLLLPAGLQRMRLPQPVLSLGRGPLSQLALRS